MLCAELCEVVVRVVAVMAQEFIGCLALSECSLCRMAANGANFSRALRAIAWMNFEYESRALATA